MKSNVIIAAIVGLILGVLAELFFAFVAQLPVLGCFVAPIAWLISLGLPILIGALAAAWSHWGVSALLDGALAALLAELASRVFEFCVSLLAVSSFSFAPRFLLPSVEPVGRMLFTGVWAIGWFVVSLIFAALLGALGAFLYGVSNRR